MFHRIKNLFPKELQKRGLLKSVHAVQIVSEWSNVIRQINAAFIDKTRAMTFKSGVLTILCEHGAVAQELELHKDKITQIYQKVFPGEHLQLRLRIGALPSQDEQMLSQ